MGLTTECDLRQITWCCFTKEFRSSFSIASFESGSGCHSSALCFFCFYFWFHPEQHQKNAPDSWCSRRKTQNSLYSCFLGTSGYGAVFMSSRVCLVCNNDQGKSPKSLKWRVLSCYTTEPHVRTFFCYYSKSVLLFPPEACLNSSCQVLTWWEPPAHE